MISVFYSTIRNFRIFAAAFFITSCQTIPTTEIEVFKYIEAPARLESELSARSTRRYVQIAPALFRLLESSSIARSLNGSPPLAFTNPNGETVTLSSYQISEIDGIKVLVSNQPDLDIEIWIDGRIVYGRFDSAVGTHIFDATSAPDVYRLSQLDPQLDQVADDAVIPPGRQTPPEPQFQQECDSNPWGLPIGKPKAILNVGVLYSAAAATKMPSIELGIRSALRRMEGAMATRNFFMRVDVATLSQTSFSETSSTASDLNRLRTSPSIAQLRDSTRSDLIAFVGDYSGTCGRGYLNENVQPSDAQFAFSVTGQACLSNETLAHEIGHNMGLRHDEATDGAGTINHGYISHSARRRSIMAYNNPCAANGYSCPRINRFSSPKYPITKTENFGNSRSNSLEVICRGAPTVARFR